MSKFDSDDDGGGMVKYADQPQVGEKVEVRSGAFQGSVGIVKKASNGRILLQSDDREFWVPEAACRPKSR